jgi:hypothetical protein
MGRIISYPELTSVSSDDYLIVDGDTNGTRKLNLNNLISPAPELISKTITTNGTYSAADDNADGYSEVTVNVSSGVSISEVENAYGTELIITTGGSPTPDPDPTPTPDPDPTPTPEPSGEWETVFDSTITSTLHTESGKYVSRIEELQDLWFSSNEIWRVTYDGVQYICPVGATNGVRSVGNSSLIDTDNGVNEPFLMYNVGGGAMICLTRTIGEHTLKLEQSV